MKKKLSLVEAMIGGGLVSGTGFITEKTDAEFEAEDAAKEEEYNRWAAEMEADRQAEAERQRDMEERGLTDADYEPPQRRSMFQKEAFLPEAKSPQELSMILQNKFNAILQTFNTNIANVPEQQQGTALQALSVALKNLENTVNNLGRRQ